MPIANIGFAQLADIGADGGFAQFAIMGADGGFGQLADMGTNGGFAEEVTAEEVVLLLLFSFTKTNKKLKKERTMSQA